ncbi:small multi-drug export protein [Desulfotomaculum varum]
MVSLLKGLPQEMLVVVIAALPVVELRGAIPYAMTVLHMSSWQAMFWSILGNAIPALVILYLLGPLQRLLQQRLPASRKWFNWLYSRSHQRGQLISRYGTMGLFLFVAVPAPGTGAWTGCIVAFLLGLCPQKALLAVLGGIVLAGVIVTLAVSGTLAVFRNFI